MGTTADKLNGLKNTKQAIKQAIIDKGVAVDEAATFASYATKIGEIQTGGGEKSLPDVKLYPDRQFTSVGNNAWLFDQIKSIDWTDFNKLGVTDMSEMFAYWHGKTLDIANLSTTGVTCMYRMFYQGQSFTSLDLSHFDTSQVTYMPEMFMLNGNSIENIIWGNNWASNPAITEFELNLDVSWRPSTGKLSKESVLDLFNKLATRDNTPTLNIPGNMYDQLIPDELAIAQNKGWTVTRVE